jgi:hypothetical protein
MSGTFVLDGTRFDGSNGGPQSPFTEAVSFLMRCADRDEVDYYWNRLVEGARKPSAGRAAAATTAGRVVPGFRRWSPKSVISSLRGLSDVTLTSYDRVIRRRDQRPMTERRRRGRAD